MSVCRSNPIHTGYVVGLNSEHAQTGLRPSFGANADSIAQSKVRQQEVSSASLFASRKPHQVQGLNSSCPSGLEILRRAVVAWLNVLGTDGCAGPAKPANSLCQGRAQFRRTCQMERCITASMLVQRYFMVAYDRVVAPESAKSFGINGSRMLLAKFPLDGRGALYEQLARVLKRAILEGHFRPGERLPATRALAQTLGLSRNTVVTAYEILRAEQLMSSSERFGARVAQMTLPAAFKAAPPAVTPAQSRYAARLRELAPQSLGQLREDLRYDLHAAPPFGPDVLRSWNRRLLSAARVAGARYPHSQGILPLRKAIAEYLARRRGVLCTEEDILIVNGTQQAISVVARAVLDEGDTVAIEDPHYLYMMQALTAHGARIVSVRTDQNGMVTGELARHRPRLICVSPSDQFPSGVVMNLERRLELLDVAARQGSWILEDDYNCEFQYRDRPLAALRSLDFSGRVIYVGTFSKTLFPSMRLGFIVCPPGIREDLCGVKRFADLGNSSLEQAALATFILSRQFDQHLRRTVVELERRRSVFLSALRRYAGERVVVQQPHAGTHVVGWLPGVTYAQLPRLIELGLARSLGLYPIHPYYRNTPPHPGLIIGYAGLSSEALRQAAQLLGACLDALDGALRPNG